MTKIIEKLFGSEEGANELQQLHVELRIAIDNLKKLEQDWHSKVRIVQQFLQKWNSDWNLNRLRQHIKVLKDIENRDVRGLDAFRGTVLHIEHAMANESIPEEARRSIREIFLREEETLKELKSSIQWQLYFIEYNVNKDIGLVRFNIKSLINALKKEGELLSLEKKEMNAVLTIERRFESRIRGGLVRKLKYKQRLERLYSIGFPKYHLENLANFLVWEWAKTDKIIKASGKHSKFVFSEGIPKFAGVLSRDNLLDIGEGLAKLVYVYGDDETGKIISKITHQYFFPRNDIYGEVIDIIVEAKDNRYFIIAALGNLREMITKENIAKIGKDLVKIANEAGEKAEPILDKGTTHFKFLINPANILEVGMCLVELVNNG